jgi:hypothetical protein
MRLPRRLAFVTLGLAAAGLLAACATAGPTVAGGSPSYTPPTGLSPGSTLPNTSPSPGSITQAPAGCTVDHLTVASYPGDAASTHRSMVLVFTNTGQDACTLYGYPGVAGLNSGGDQIAQATRTTSGYLGGLPAGQKAQEVDLASGESASAIVEALAANPDGSSCTAFAALLVTPPNETHSVKVAWDNDGCSSLEIHPVVPGKTGRVS